MTEARPYDAIVVSTADSVTTVTLNRPERRNAIGPTMMNELLYAFEDATADEGVRSIVLTGAGKTFCAGGDFAEMASGGKASALPPKGDFKDLLLAMWRTEKPIVAKVNGHAMGGGLGLVAACTFAIASEDAKLGTPEIDVGLFPFMIYAVLERNVSRRRLVEMMLFGEKLTAGDAVKVGLLNLAVPAAGLDEAVSRYTKQIASKSPSTVRLGLQALRDVDELRMEEKLPVLSERLARCLGTEDAREGLMAFLEKREPKWTGR
jgi:enoyl-CoA hydratase/carnithine racemase